MADIISFKQGVFTTDSAIVGTPTLVPGTINFSTSANLEGFGTPIVGLINPGSFNATLSTTSVVFTYNDGLSGLARTATRVVTLSSNTGVNSTFVTRISSAFTCAAVYTNRTASYYTVSADAAMPATAALVPSQIRVDTIVGPNTRRLVQLGYV